MAELVNKEISLPADPKRKMREHAAATGSNLADLVAAMVETYVEGGYESGGLVDISKVEDPGPQNTGRIRFKVDRDIWRAAAVRAVREETSIASVMRRASIALNA